MPGTALVRAAHIEPSLAVTVVASVLARSAGQEPSAVVVVALAVLAGQLSVGWSNDWLDAGRDRAAGRADKPIPSGDVSVETVRAAALVALPVALLLSGPSGVAATAVHAGALAAAWGYNLRLKATALSVVPYAVAFGLLPSFVTLPVSGWAPWWATATAALLGAGAHFTNTLPDLAHDASSGVQGLPHILGARRSQLAAAALLGGAVMVLLAGTWPAAAPALVVALASLGLVVVAAARASFRLTIAAALGVLVTFLLSGARL
jgi:heme o synthase